MNLNISIWLIVFSALFSRTRHIYQSYDVIRESCILFLQWPWILTSFNLRPVPSQSNDKWKIEGGRNPTPPPRPKRKRSKNTLNVRWLRLTKNITDHTRYSEWAVGVHLTSHLTPNVWTSHLHCYNQDWQ